MGSSSACEALLKTIVQQENVSSMPHTHTHTHTHLTYIALILLQGVTFCDNAQRAHGHPTPWRCHTCGRSFHDDDTALLGAGVCSPNLHLHYFCVNTFPSGTPLLLLLLCAC